MKPEITPQIGEATIKAKTKRLWYVQLALISPSIVIVALLALGWFRVPHFFALERIFHWIGLAVFYTSPILLLYNIAVYMLLARRLNQNHSWIETAMMAIVIQASLLLFLVVVFLILTIRDGGIMPFPAG